jgi:hypothetical protein
MALVPRTWEDILIDCGFHTAQRRNAAIAEGLSGIDALLLYTEKNVSTLFYQLSRRGSISQAVIIRMKAVHYLISECDDRNIPIIEDDITLPIIDEYCRKNEDR